VAAPRPSRVSSAKVLRELRTAARKGDRAALTLALAEMRVLALSPRYWEKYLALLTNPLARLVDLLVIKQGERIAHQKGWRTRGAGLRPPSAGRRPTAAGASDAHAARRSPPAKRATRRRRTAPAPEQPSLFEL